MNETEYGEGSKLQDKEFLIKTDCGDLILKLEPLGNFRYDRLNEDFFIRMLMLPIRGHLAYTGGEYTIEDHEFFFHVSNGRLDHFTMYEWIYDSFGDFARRFTCSLEGYIEEWIKENKELLIEEHKQHMSRAIYALNQIQSETKNYLELIGKRLETAAYYKDAWWDKK